MATPASGSSARDETPRARYDRELLEMLQELRVIVAGVQFLFAFLLTLPFSSGFKRVGHVGHWVYYLSLITAACASICLMAPAAQHRMLFRSGRKDLLITRSNRYGIVGTLALTVSMSSAVAVAAKGFFSSTLTAVTASAIVAVAAWAWFVQPMLTRRRIPSRAEEEHHDAERRGSKATDPVRADASAPERRNAEATGPVQTEPPAPERQGSEAADPVQTDASGTGREAGPHPVDPQDAECREGDGPSGGPARPPVID
ncbi:hypothetical protein GCM10023196_073490 [Actinoallomurus vinaceus]|uniref:Integral membrane protein n=1 Tax=Actinoallomurus vinaceus TaxID=1080074 RepID=A0ABP8ULA1_9ACTN